jgi:hypothetical protein
MWQHDPNQEINNWIRIWDSNWEGLGKTQEDSAVIEEGCYDLFDVARDARFIMEELAHNLEIQDQVALAILQDLCPTFSGEELGRLYDVYYQRIVKHLKKEKIIR